MAMEQQQQIDDRISALPDDLLRSFLLRLPGTADAARTSVLSRRWRHLWADLPELSFRYCMEPPDSSTARVLQPAERIDEALLTRSAQTIPVRRMEINLWSSRVNTDIDMAGHVSSWLRFAEKHLAGGLEISLPMIWQKNHAAISNSKVKLPVCESITSIRFDLHGCTLLFQPPQRDNGVFHALTTLRLVHAHVDGRNLQDVLCSRCPRLKELILELIILQLGRGAPNNTFSIRSNSLERLEIAKNLFNRPSLLVVATPVLQAFCCEGFISHDFHITAPKLTEVVWDNINVYYPSRYHFAEAGCHLQRLEIHDISLGSALMQQFNTVHELHLTVSVTKGIQQYTSFLEDINKLSKCEVLVVTFKQMEHDFMPAMIHLLRKCPGIRKLVVKLSSLRVAQSIFESDEYPCKSPSGCPCSWEENRKADNIVLSFLEVVEVKDQYARHTDHKVLELVRLLCCCSATFQKNVAITVSGGAQSECIGNKIRSMIASSNNKVEITLRSSVRRVMV